MDSQITELLYALAQLAGIFVGFGALISFARDRHTSIHELFMIRAVVTVGLFVLVGSLLPLLLGLYGIAESLFWRSAGGILFLMNLGSIYVQFAPSEIRQSYGNVARANPVAATFFWLFLEGASQVLLILLVFAAFPPLSPAFYVTVLIINLFQATYLLATLVYGRKGEKSGPPPTDPV